MRTSFMTGIRALALAALIAVPTAAAADMTEREKELYEAARANGESVTWYIAHFSSETAEAVGHAFREKYPGVEINVARSTAQVAFNRLSQDLRAGIAQCDVFSTTDVGHYSFLKGEDLLMQYVPENADKVYSVFREAHDPDGYYHITSGGKVLLTYNTEMVSEDEAPKNWTDLLDPKWKDQVSVGHPAYSGYVGTWVVLMEKLYGWEYFEKLEQNNPQIGRSINDTVTMLNARERAVAAGPEATTLRSASRGNPLAVVYPEDGALLMITPSAIMANTENPNAAKLFMEFLLGPENAKVQAEYFQEVVRADMPPAEGARTLDEFQAIRPTHEEIEKGIPEMIENWRDLFGS